MANKRIDTPPFPGGKRLAVTFSFDDGVVYDRRVVAAFNDWGLKGTFNLNSGFLGRTGRPAPEGTRYLDASEVEPLYRGHEVAIHTVTHPHLPRLDPAQVAVEVLDDRRGLEDLVGYPVRGMAYPFGTYDARVIETLRGLGIVYARTVENHPRPFPPAEPLAFAATMHHYHADPDDVPTRFRQMHENPRASGVFFVWGHTYEFNDRDDWAALERLFKPLAGHDDVWYCTNIELFDYEEARKRLVVAANRGSVYNPSGIPVTVETGGRFQDVPPGATLQVG